MLLFVENPVLENRQGKLKKYKEKILQTRVSNPTIT